MNISKVPNIPMLEKSASMMDPSAEQKHHSQSSKGHDPPASPTGVWDLSFLFGGGDPKAEDNATVVSIDNTILSQPNLARIPERLVDFFCIIGSEIGTITDFAESPKDVKLNASLLDCYPKYRTDMDFPDELPMFCMPNGIHLSTEKKPPELATFVLTSSAGNRLYGSVLTTHEPVPLEDLCEAFWEGNCLLPAWLEQPSPFYLPKCLVVISHHGFYDVQGTFLKQLHRIAASGKSPLPLERYVANFLHDIPLPRPGATKVSWKCFTKDSQVCYRRPATNELPLVNFSYKAVFRSLSITNILTLWGILLGEGRIVLQSENQALLTPVAEALTSFLFPFTWQGMYVPVLPSSMLEILEAPVPFLVGFVGRQSPQPTGVVVCDLDQDIVHLGTDDHNQSRVLPQLPKNLVGDLKAELENVGDNLFLIPPCGVKGRITTAIHGLMENYMREPYANQMDMMELSMSNTHRHFILLHANLIQHASPLEPSDFVTVGEEQTKYESLDEDTKPKNRKHGGPTLLNSIKRGSRAIKATTGGYVLGTRGAKKYDEVMDKYRFTIAKSLYEVDDKLSDSVRYSFLRFFSTLLMDYKSFSKCDGAFDTEEFIESLKDLSHGNKLFVKSMLQTQMFERFLVESSTRRRLFDEHVKVQQNEGILSKKQETPFLDEQSQITKIIKPAAPCFAGVRRGKTFHYGNIPSQLDSAELVAHKNLDPVSALCYLGSDALCGGFDW